MFSPELIALASYMAGEFDNREQAIAVPAWYVLLRLWQRPVHLFSEYSLSLFADQANSLYLDRDYRPRIIRLKQAVDPHSPLQVQYYMIKDLSSIKGAGRNPELLNAIDLDLIELLPGCKLDVKIRPLVASEYNFQASLPPNARCCFSYNDRSYQVSLGFEASPQEFLSYDKGIDPETGKAIWGAIMGPFRFRKLQDFSNELPI